MSESRQMYISTAEQVKALGSKVKLNHIDYDRAMVNTMPASQVKELVRQIVGRKTMSLPYLFTEKQVKIAKSNKKGVELNAVMHLAPSDMCGVINTCAGATAGCRAACLNLSGKGRLNDIQVARIRKTLLFVYHRELFGRLMDIELDYWKRRAKRLGFKGFACRPNGTSDIRWEIVYPWMFDKHSDVEFYDYTKLANRRKVPSNYHLTFSRSENNDENVQNLLDSGKNVAIVFSNLETVLEHGYCGWPVVDGMSTDRRYADPTGCIVGLKPLGEAKKDRSGFVVHNH